jgi:hypothetical protein
MRSIVSSETREREGVGFAFPALFWTGDVFEKGAEVVVDNSGIEESGRSFLGAFSGSDFAKIEISE